MKTAGEQLVDAVHDLHGRVLIAQQGALCVALREALPQWGLITRYGNMVNPS